MNIPPGFRVIAQVIGGNSIAGIASSDDLLYGLQFHPEVLETKQGARILENFVEGIAKCQRDWKPENLISSIGSEILAVTGGEASSLLFSGGVDSTTLAAIASTVLGGKLKGLCLDFGQLRLNEEVEIRKHADYANLNSLQMIDGRERFERICSHQQEPADPEAKRKLFRMVYSQCIEDFLKSSNAANFIQGTLAPDMIESGMTGGDCIKTHHNTGIDIPGCKEVFPFAKLFKYEVRALAKELELPESVVNRQPFPGPGLFIRIVGGWPTKERLEILRWADAEVRRLVAEAGIGNDQISQLIVALPVIKVVGVKGDQRTHAYPIWVRGVKTLDFMTARGYRFPDELWTKIVSTLTRHKDIVTVMADEAPKPPRTVEFE